MALGEEVLPAEAGPIQEHHLRVRAGDEERRTDPVPAGVLPVRIIFLIFDVEAIFLLPFAVAFTGLTVGASIAMLVFFCCWPRGWCGPGRKGF